MPELRVPQRFAERAFLGKMEWLGPANRKALEYCVRFSQDPERTAPPLLLSKSGVGKTHLLYAMARAIHEGQAKAVDVAVAAAEQERFALIEGGRSTSGHKAMLPKPMDILVTQGAEIAHDIRETVRKGNLDEVVSRYRQSKAVSKGSVAILFVDDIEVMKMGDWLGEELYRIFDHRYAENLPTAMATNLSAKELRGHLMDRVARRVFDMTEPFELK